MKCTTICFSIASVAAVFALSATAMQDKKPQDPKAGAEHAMPEVKAGPEHAILAKDVGTWDCTVTDYMSGTPVVSKGVDTVKMVGGLWSVDDFTSEMGGKPFLGHGVTGYDQDKKKYVGVWVDTMSTSIMPTEGSYDAAAKKMTCVGKMPDGSELTMVTEHKDADNRTFTMSMPGEGGKAMTCMVIEYKRRK